ncbi:Phosphatidate cytidylyltransferase [Pseudoclavibacter triregionum]|nr:Phosphatidate cytidylyltransferase [Pseudoclavibacter triregionum]
MNDDPLAARGAAAAGGVAPGLPDPVADPSAAPASAITPDAADPAARASSWRRAVSAVRGERSRIRRRQEELNKRSGRNLGAAIGIGALIGIALVLSLIFWKPLFNLFGMAMVALGTAELASTMRSAGRDVPRIPTVVLGTAVVPIAYYLGPAAQWIALCAVIAAVSIWRLAEVAVSRSRPSAADVRRDLLAGAFIQLYVTFLGSFTILLAAQPMGEWWVLGFIIPVVAIDTGALAAGVKFGRTKLAPSISGGKTWEGLAGGGVAGVVAAVLVAVFLLREPWWTGLIIGPVLLVSATLGDLFESMVKRDLGVKDMSNWVPGHGGILDRLDSILPSGAMMFALYFVIGSLIGV